MPRTIKDVANAANVSSATVSLVLNGKGDISGATRARVLEAASRLDYAPRAQRQPRAAEPVLGFLKIAKHGHTVNRDHSTFISDYIDGMSSEAAKRGYRLEVVSHEGQSIREIGQAMASPDLAACGLIVLGTELSEADVRMLGSLGPPKVFIDTYFEFLSDNFVNMDNHDAVHQVVRRLAASGFRRIGFVASYVETRNFQLRLDAFTQTMKALGMPVRKGDVVQVDSTFEGAYRDMAAHLARSVELPECFFCTNDIIALGCIRALREADRRIPDDVSIIGFDNLPMSATTEPPLTTVDISKRKIGNLAIALLDDVLRSPDSQPPIKMLVGASIVSRSSDVAAVRPVLSEA